MQVEILEKNLTKTHKFHSENFQYSLHHYPDQILDEPPKDSIEAESIKIKASFGQRDHEHIDGQENKGSEDNQAPEDGQGYEDGQGTNDNDEVKSETSTITTPVTTSQTSTSFDLITTEEAEIETTKLPTEIPVIFTTSEMTTENGSGDSTTEDQFTTLAFLESTLQPTTTAPLVEFETTQSVKKAGFQINAF